MAEVIDEVKELVAVLEICTVRSNVILDIASKARHELVSIVKSLDNCNIPHLLLRLKQDWSKGE